jgi:hypothetical protein
MGLVRANIIRQVRMCKAHMVHTDRYCETCVDMLTGASPLTASVRKACALYRACR